MTAACETPGWVRVRPDLRDMCRRGVPTAFLYQATEANRRAGDYVDFGLGWMRDHVIGHPDDIEHVLSRNWQNYVRGVPPWSYTGRGGGRGLITSDGSLHREQRRILLPLFQPHRVEGYVPIVQEEIARLRARWTRASGETVDVFQEMLRLALMIMARILFGIDLEQDAQRIARAIADLNAAAVRFDASLRGLLYFVPTRTNRRFRAAKRYLHHLLTELIERRLRQGPDPSLLSVLLERMDRRQLRDELITLFGAGHESTASLLSFTWYLLARNPEAAERLRAELRRVLDGRPAELEDLPQLPYTEWVVKESLRLYPVGWYINRVAIGEDVVGGRRVRAGTNVVTLPWLVHRDPRWFPDPTCFRPERFAPEATKERPRFAYFPFGGGDRTCIGKALSEMEARLAIATLAQEFDPRPLPSHELELEAFVSLRPRGGLPMTLARAGTAARHSDLAHRA